MNPVHYLSVLAKEVLTISEDRLTSDSDNGSRSIPKLFGPSETSSSTVKDERDCKIRSLRRQRGSRTLHLAYWSHVSSSSEHAVTKNGPSIA